MDKLQIDPKVMGNVLSGVAIVLTCALGSWQIWLAAERSNKAKAIAIMMLMSTSLTIVVVLILSTRPIPKQETKATKLGKHDGYDVYAILPDHWTLSQKKKGYKITPIINKFLNSSYFDDKLYMTDYLDSPFDDKQSNTFTIESNNKSFAKKCFISIGIVNWIPYKSSSDIRKIYDFIFRKEDEIISKLEESGKAKKSEISAYLMARDQSKRRYHNSNYSKSAFILHKAVHNYTLSNKDTQRWLKEYTEHMKSKEKEINKSLESLLKLGLEISLSYVNEVYNSNITKERQHIKGKNTIEKVILKRSYTHVNPKDGRLSYRHHIVLDRNLENFFYAWATIGWVKNKKRTYIISGDCDLKDKKILNEDMDSISKSIRLDRKSKEK